MLNSYNGHGLFPSPRGDEGPSQKKRFSTTTTTNFDQSMLCVVIGIVPPLDDSTRTRLFHSNVTTTTTTELNSSKTRVCWARDTIEQSWVVPDEDADNIPTMLVSAVLSEQSSHSGENVFGSSSNDLDMTPEEFASLVQDEINNHNDSQENYCCEVWASAPAPLPLLKFGKNSEPSDLCRLQSDFVQKGLCLLPNVFSSSKEMDNTDMKLLAKVRFMVDGAIREAEGAIAANHPTINVGEDAFLFREIASRSKQRFDLLIAKESDLYRLVREQVLGGQSEIPNLLQNLFLGTENNDNNDDCTVEWDMDLSVVYSKPGANHQGWHADGGHMEGDSDIGWDESSNNNNNKIKTLAAPYAICLFVPLIDLNPTVGFTQFWPGSHQYKELVGFGPFCEVAKATWDGIVSAGEAIVYDYRLLHRGMPNYSKEDAGASSSSDEETSEHFHPYRAVLQLLCRRSWYKERNNYGKDSIYQSAAVSS